MKNLFKKFFNCDYRHLLCLFLILSSLFISILFFSYAPVRILESVRDLWSSLRHYFHYIFLQDNLDLATVNELSKVPFSMPFGLPDNWEDFKLDLQVFGELFISGDNFTSYLDFLSDILYHLSFGLLLVLPLVLAVYILFKRSFRRQNNDYNKDSQPLTFWKALENKVFVPIKTWFMGFRAFVKEHKVYKIIFFCLWGYSFNLFSIVISFVAFYLYFICSFSFEGIFRQLYKLFFDLSPMTNFVPVPLWIVVGFIIFDRIRKKIAYSRLNHMEMKNRGFINSLPIVVMGCGTMGSQKTTMITDMGLSQEVMFRDKAFEKILENDLKFPNFPWINLENVLKTAIDRHYVFSLATCKQFILRLRKYYLTAVNCPNYRKSLKRHLKKFGVNLGDNFLFDYDYEKYGLTFNDQLKIVDIWEVIETYSELYFFYTIQSSLLVSNYSVRTDNLLEDVGNFPVWNTDFFRRDTRLQDSFSRHAHILDFDMLRLGKKVIEENPLSDVFEFGIVLCTEIGKERGNSPELLEKKKSSPEANQKNDLLENEFKMIRHGGSIDNFPFVRVFVDEQRPESWGANGRDLCNILHMDEASDLKLAMPFFAFGELLFSFVKGKFEDLYSEYRFNRGDNTLFMYLFKKVCAGIINRYKGLYNRFGFMEKRIELENGTQDGELRKVVYYLLVQKIYSKRFSTDCHSGFFYTKSLRSFLGFNDIPEYSSVRATMEELEKQNSYFIADLNAGLKEFDKIVG